MSSVACLAGGSADLWYSWMAAARLSTSARTSTIFFSRAAGDLHRAHRIASLSWTSFFTRSASPLRAAAATPDALLSRVGEQLEQPTPNDFSARARGVQIG